MNVKKLLVTVSMMAMLSACAMTPEPLTSQQLADTAKQDRDAMFQQAEPLTGPLTVQEAIARALKFNLDRKSKMMEEALALGQTALDRWDMLPKLVANSNFTSRSEPNSTKSKDVVTGQISSSNPSYSTDRDNYTMDLGLSWNVLDFGVSYFTAQQNADRSLIATERKRKAVQNLITEVRFAFWRAAAYQELQDDVEKAVAAAKIALDKAKTVEKENLKSPAEALRYQKSLMETLRQLTTIQQELSSAPIELAALINVLPGTKIELDVPKDMALPEWDMPVEQMEELAFINNPDLREQMYLSRIAVDDTRKAILKMLPGISLTTGYNYDHNSFLMDNRWFEAGTKLSWNLMNVLQAPDAYAYATSNEDVNKMRRVALRMAVLAQVHVSHRQFLNLSNQFGQADELWKVDQRLYDLAVVKTENDAQGMLERVVGHASAIASKLRRFQTYAQVEQAYAKMQASLGRDLMPDDVASHNTKDLSATIAQRLTEWKIYN